MTKFRDLTLIFHHIYLFYLHFQDFQALFQTHIFNSLIFFKINLLLENMATVYVIGIVGNRMATKYFS